MAGREKRNRRYLEVTQWLNVPGLGFPSGSEGRICLQCGRPGFDPWVAKIPWRKAWHPTPVVLPGESPWTEEPGGLESTELQRVRHDWATEHRQQRLNRSFSGSDGNESACNAGDQGSIPGSGRPPEEGSGNPLQYSCLGNSMDGGAWWATVCGITKSQTQLSDCTHTEHIEWVSNKTRDDWLKGQRLGHPQISRMGNQLFSLPSGTQVEKRSEKRDLGERRRELTFWFWGSRRRAKLKSRVQWRNESFGSGQWPARHFLISL